MTVYKQARLYVEKYGWSVIPIRKGTKEPNLPTWKEYRDRYPTEAELEAWFLNQQNDIAIVTGRLSNLSVLDVDVKHNHHNIRSTIVVSTKKGRHFYFKFNDQLKNHVRILDDVDIRSEGGYVVGPSTSGYRFINPYFSINSLPDFPIDLLPKDKVSNRNAPGWFGEALKSLEEGNRDDTFTQIIGRLHYDGYTANDINVLLSPHAERCGFDTLESKVEHIVNDYPNLSDGNEEDESDSLSQFMEDIQPIRWICEPLIGRGNIGFIAGLPETMKTWICADLAIEVSRGGRWLGKFPTSKGRVVFIDQERYKGEVQRRFKLLMAEKGLSPKDLEGELILKSQTTTRLDLEESFNAFKRKLVEIKPVLVIVDSFTTFHTKEENNRKDIQIVIERVKELRKEIGCTILFIDHENKSVLNPEDNKSMPDAFKMVGSVGKPAAAETVFTVRKLNESEVVMYHTKSTLSPTIEPIKLKIVDTAKGVLIQ